MFPLAVCATAKGASPSAKASAKPIMRFIHILLFGVVVIDLTQKQCVTHSSPLAIHGPKEQLNIYMRMKLPKVLCHMKLDLKINFNYLNWGSTIRSASGFMDQGFNRLDLGSGGSSDRRICLDDK
jgi:hypothetical protein